ncbi:pseudaminic acid synthase [Halalkalibacillus halophilus]|uniref:pseudaminic acid synthase n=1 Tax=Halalkalibacillus halophilus TaxID=392827 RepID=UPI000412983D|nr:pseudaminic acid synthase [Halalkalibacillus halophilus]
MNEMKIGERKIGSGNPPFIIAEMSGNHNHSLTRALEIVDAAAKAGADAIKIQTFTAETMTLDDAREEFIIQDDNSPWNGQSLFELYKKAHTPWEWHQPIFDRCKELGMIGFSTPFDETAVDFLESIQTPCYKIASFECTDLPLIRKVAQTKKPMIISTGLCTAGEIEETVNAARESGCENLILLKCTSTYPATPENTNIRTIPHMRELFQCEVGLSDHTMGSGVAVASVALGATVIEKHLTLWRSDGGVDASFSLEPDELLNLTTEVQRAWQALGGVTYGATKEEEASMKYRRSLYVTKDMKEGERFTKENLKAIRPGHGIPPKYYNVLLGKKVNRDVRRGIAVTWDIV